MRKPAATVVYMVCGLSGFALMRAPAGAQDNHGSTILILKDPTPRPPDLDKIYGNPADQNSADSARKVAEYNQQRFALITRASGQVDTLAETLQKAMAQEQSDAVLGQEARVAAAIEVLAGNVHMALLPNGVEKASKLDEKVKPSKPAKMEAADLGQLRSKVDALRALADGLHTDVAKSGPDTLSVGVLTKSVQIRDMARDLKRRMSRL